MATDGTVDSDDQIVDPDWSGKAIQEWLSTGGNLRVQHSPYLYPAGRGIDTEKSPQGGHYITALVVEPTAKKLVEKGVLQAFSVGISRPKIVGDSVAKGGRIIDGKLIEISLVDRPANPNCGFAIVKSEDGTPTDAEEAFGQVQAMLAKAEQKDAELDLYAAYAAAREELATKVSDASDLLMIRKSTGLDGTAEGFALWSLKRDFDSGVGASGKDRDKIPAEDFAGPNRTYPITTQSDVDDAATLIGHADNPAEVKANIIRIAKRKGFSIPDAWQEKGTSVDVEKGAKNCTGCGKHYDADSKVRNCESCGDSLPAADKTVEPESVKGAKDCKSCGKNYDADSKQRNCENCGADLPHADGSGGDDSADKSRHDTRHPVTGQYVPSDHPDVQSNDESNDTKPQPSVSADDSPSTDKHSADDLTSGSTGLAQHKSKMPYSVRRLHDLMCAAYSQDTVAAEYPSVKSFNDAIVVDDVVKTVGEEWREELELMKGVDTTAFIDALTSNSNAFAADYPNAHLTPGSITPGSFNRPYLTSGHAREAATSVGSANPVSGHDVEADDFNRGPLTAGHEDDSPANKSSNSSMQSMYASASASYLKNRLQNLHDRITHDHPNVCALASQVSFQDNRQNAGLSPQTAGKTGTAPGEKTSTSDIIKSAVDSAVAATSEKYDSILADLQKQLTELGSQPDLSQAPVRGALAARVAEGDKAAPVARKSLVAETHEKVTTTETDEDVQTFLYASKILASGDPNMRKAAEETIKSLQANPDFVKKLLTSN